MFFFFLSLLNGQLSGCLVTAGICMCVIIMRAEAHLS